MNFQDNLIENELGVERVVKSSKRVAVLGIKTEQQSGQPAFYVPDYLARGDLEIWYVHPYERTLTAWRRQSQGIYTETVYRGGIVHPESLPGRRFRSAEALALYRVNALDAGVKGALEHGLG